MAISGITGGPAKKIMKNNEKQELESLPEDGALVIRFNDKWFRSRSEFFLKAVLNNHKLTALYDDLYGFEVTIDDGDH